MNMDLPKYENSKVTHEQTVELHKLLVQTVIDFLKKENIDEVWEVQFSADGLEDGVIANSLGVMQKVKAFTEKPSLDVAKKFVESGDFLWNSGIFIWNLRALESSLAEHMPELAQKFKLGEDVMGTDDEDAFIQDMFPTCPSISIDYGLMEKARNVYVMPSDFGWSDVGTWGSVYQLSRKDAYANAKWSYAAGRRCCMNYCAIRYNK